VRRVLRGLRRAEPALEPAPHSSLGLPAYLQVTSPLRRYQDLATHRQIVAHLAGAPPAHDPEAMQRILATTEQADQDARRAERMIDEYWILRWLETQVGTEVEALVVETEPRPIVQLMDTLREQPLPSLAGVLPGDRVRLRIERGNPRAGLLVLRAQR
jgi:exoribonuclease-2